MKNILGRTKTTVKKFEPVKARGYAHQLKIQLVPKAFQKTEIHLDLTQNENINIHKFVILLLPQEFTFDFPETHH